MTFRILTNGKVSTVKLNILDAVSFK